MAPKIPTVWSKADMKSKVKVNKMLKLTFFGSKIVNTIHDQI